MSAETAAEGAAAPPSDAIALSTIGQIAVAVRDLPAMRAFYREVLRLPFLFDAPGMAFFDCGGVRLMLALPEAGKDAVERGSVLYFTVPDIAAAHAALAARGVAFVGVPHVVHRAPGLELWMAFFRDPEANLLALMSEVTPPR
jgi:methylmalonyl-CoA/ethylmalonyl-CoA epimerase